MKIRLAILSSVLLGSASASANQDIQDGVPGSTCTHCHSGAGSVEDVKPVFGAEFTGLGAPDTRTGPARAKWQDEVHKADSDGDGQINGLELGDPCGTGLLERSTDISDPSNADSTTPAMMPQCTATPGGSVGAGPATPPPPFQSGICAVQGALGQGNAAPGWASLILGAAALVAGRRRLRRRAG